MPSEKSRIGGGGTRITEDLRSGTKTTDYDPYGKKVSRTRTDSNGNIWNENSAGRIDKKLGNDGRFKK